MEHRCARASAEHSRPLAEIGLSAGATGGGVHLAGLPGPLTTQTMTASRSAHTGARATVFSRGRRHLLAAVTEAALATSGLGCENPGQ
jgi:hypothetical protein